MLKPPEIHLHKPKLMRGLRWKLAFWFLVSGFLTCFVSMQASDAIDFVYFQKSLNPEAIKSEVEPELPLLIENLQTDRRDLAAVQQWLRGYRYRAEIAKRDALELMSLNESENFLEVWIVDAQGNVIFEKGDVFSQSEFGEQRFASLGNDSATVDIELRDATDVFLGTLSIKKYFPFALNDALRQTALNFAAEMQSAFYYMIGFGLIFGFLISRPLISRLNRIAFAAESWSKGDFSARATDDSPDEIGILSKRLNLMANDLKEVFALRQELSAIEERNRIARELHDSIKQTAFALTLQISTARLTLETDSTEAKTRLERAEKLSNEVQKELVNLIRELRPLSEKGEVLEQKLKNFVFEWSKQHDIAADFATQNLPKVSPATEHALFRIAQEALANVAKHSRATKVAVNLNYSPTGELCLGITDNGNGFDSENSQSGSGLRNMRERAELLPFGTFSILGGGSGATIQVGCCPAKIIRKS